MKEEVMQLREQIIERLDELKKYNQLMEKLNDYEDTIREKNNLIQDRIKENEKYIYCKEMEEEVQKLYQKYNVENDLERLDALAIKAIRYIDTLANFDLLFSKMIVEDIEYCIETFNPRSKRTTFSILRDTTENVIFYLYIVNQLEESELDAFLTEYFGGNLIDKVDDISKLKYFDLLKKIGENRYHSFIKPKTACMAKKIGEYDKRNNICSDGLLNLYSVFRILSDYTHEGYFLDYFWNFEDSKEQDTELFQWISMILSKFCKKHWKIYAESMKAMSNKWL